MTVGEHVTAVDAFNELSYIKEPTVFKTFDTAKVEQIIESNDRMPGQLSIQAVPLKAPLISRL